MVLGGVLRDEKGNVLLAEGVVLTEGMLASLGAMASSCCPSWPPSRGAPGRPGPRAGKAG
jgi:hypothetical protein